MPHPIRRGDRDALLDHFQYLFSLLLDANRDMGTKIEQLLADETPELGMDYGFFSRIDLDAATQRFEIVYSPGGEITEGDTVMLSNTYCRKMIEDPDGTLAVDDALEEGWADDPAYETFDIGSFLGTTVTVDDDLFGALCFAKTDPRESPFTDEEVLLVELYGQWVRYELNLWNAAPTEDPLRVDLDDHDISADQIDVMMDILRDRSRRSILMAVLRDPNEIQIDDLYGVLDDKTTEESLYHNHLPKMEQARYIEWDRDADTISVGPEFYAVEPLLQLLFDYQAP